MEINYNNNEKAIKELNKGLEKSYNLFLYGDKNSGTKPGNIQVYGTIAGQKQVLKERIKQRENLASQQEDY